MRKINLFVLLLLIFSNCAHKKEVKPSFRKEIKRKIDDNLKEIDTSLNSNSQLGTTPKFVIYENEPIPMPGNAIPNYTDSARRAGLEGRVIVRMEVFENGVVGAVEIVKSLQSGEGGLDEQAIKAVKTWKFIPAKNKGKPVSVWVTFPIYFRL